MMRGLRLTAAVAGLLGVCCVGSSSAAQRVSAPVPSLASVVLATTDFASGGHVASQGAVTVGGLPGYIREFKAGAKLGGKPLLLAIGIGLLEPDAASAHSDLTQVEGVAQTKAGRQALAKAWGTEFLKGANAGGGHKVTVKSTVVGPPVLVGDGGMRLALTISSNIGTLRMAIGFVQTDRVLEIVELAGRLNERIATGDIARVISAVKQHLQAAFTVISTSPPTIGGTPQQGQALTVDEGAWTGAPSGFTYVWSHCDATGNACAPIAGATANSYVPGIGDSGMTIRVGVTGANSVTSQQATSLPSPPIP
jgi:hypothetical protein